MNVKSFQEKKESKQANRIFWSQGQNQPKQFTQQLYQMNRQSRHALSLQALSKHQKRIQQMVKNIERYKPTFHKNERYSRKEIEKRMLEREQESQKLFEQNMKLIYRIETTGPKVQTKKFPQVQPNPRRLKTLNIRNASKSSTKSRIQVKDVFRNPDELFEQNIKMITNIECTGPKISCWTARKVRTINQVLKAKKHEQQKKILEKYKEINKQISRLNKMRSFRRSPSISSINQNSKSSLH